MNIYIDVGVGDGDTILQFRNWISLIGFENPTVYGFEPNPFLKKKWKRHVRKDTIIEQKAAWIRSGEIELSVTKDVLGSTVMKEKEGYAEGEKVKVPCFDFSGWLEQFRGDNVILKVDCEGAELPIFTKMIKDGTDDIPFVTMVEWHDGKMPTYESNKDSIWKYYRGKLIEWR